MDCDAVLFDLDGVLIDSTAVIERHWRQWGQRHGIGLAEIMQVAHGRRTVETIRLVAPYLNVEEEARRLEAGESVDTQGVIAIKGASSLLHSLPTDTWAIATSGTRNVATTRIIHAGLPVPGILVTAEDVLRGKPDPDPFLAAASGLGVPPGRCVVIEDSPAGIEAACAAGMRTVAVATTHAPHELGRADAIVGRLSDLHIESGNGSRLAIRIESDRNLASAR